MTVSDGHGAFGWPYIGCISVQWVSSSVHEVFGTEIVTAYIAALGSVWAY